MAETTTATPSKAPEKPKRPAETIQADLDAANAKLRELHPQVEADARKQRNQESRIERAKLRWKTERPDEPFDPEAYNPPLHPYPGDVALHKAFHKQHYVVKGFEDELGAANLAD